MRKPLEVKADITALLLTAGYHITGIAIGPSSVSVTVSLEDSDEQKLCIEDEKLLWRKNLLGERASRAERAIAILRSAGLPVTMHYRERVEIAARGEFLLSLQDDQMGPTGLEDAHAPVEAGDQE